MIIDSIFNTFLLTKSKSSSTWTMDCDLGVFTTVVAFFGIMFIYLARMRRVYKIFHFYQEYLNRQLADLDIEI
jgi:hypothetical protein